MAHTLKQKLSDTFVIAPGVYDLISAKIADQKGFDAIYMTGYGTVASYLGLPDAGIATYRDMVERAGQIAKMTNTPLIADGDTGYGGLLNVSYTVRGYEAAGVSAIQLEDQEFPKKCGHTPNRRVVPLDDMLRKIEVACDSRASDDFLIIARTDARTALGIEEAIRRGKAFKEAGADIVFVEAPESEEEMRRICSEIEGPLLANMVEGGSTPILSARHLQRIGYALAIFPGSGFLAAGQAIDTVYNDIKENGRTTHKSDLYEFSRFSELIGFPEVWEFERRYPEK
ncbi:carboxyvinyl-carboxyphosphonate phosphorylmutase [Roseobacter sp. HKCCD9010]|uniref:isocitrate lyase/PEP mutase family protein n=1 Tax=unclassified Roseobacter TaxID=196798 RepID=UPI00149276FC|nr:MULTISPECIES: isocitrate lyase/PEP mutase family protein [unclassified Roseobacter]MBF9052246.1 carboxyvinyl-carboxyphosphonate phosphorylmutase [Rhodobacterales bacterium HKCCD4356]NNV14085.1 carboxyvinyl-carboxyphosphonate phosphorylmutase [Roseobacter sp. HKCCD7357]NNV18406.1 carboxyvinyl-carboxyphosphonate phosphorylmutase [Roseobacter sp. HKCCD8768]NNV27845.1 carboxyvinyl-carboxyphosphonate phosphorylmutase [Roseobacter sp. HKCCD8192]NNV32163.1 carboxyvinyl-carboxyphosphonate phosphory